jgi:hypothetical protein
MRIRLGEEMSPGEPLRPGSRKLHGGHGAGGMPVSGGITPCCC